eukprot:TRINITY_DN2146_c0_g1_i3.p1 TRINITY_DN2146_c0_g1~~TRINITY_DN2146_c0_g1_i3.p1  ORF type:complete len:295 (+),score=38.02 TRINITY_DN2146_c0_g1_i3:356-1240(+)
MRIPFMGKDTTDRSGFDHERNLSLILHSQFYMGKVARARCTISCWLYTGRFVAFGVVQGVAQPCFSSDDYVKVATVILIPAGVDRNTFGVWLAANDSVDVMPVVASAVPSEAADVMRSKAAKIAVGWIPSVLVHVLDAFSLLNGRFKPVKTYAPFIVFLIPFAFVWYWGLGWEPIGAFGVRFADNFSFAGLVPWIVVSIIASIAVIVTCFSIVDTTAIIAKALYNKRVSRACIAVVLWCYALAAVLDGGVWLPFLVLLIARRLCLDKKPNNGAAPPRRSYAGFSGQTGNPSQLY